MNKKPLKEIISKMEQSPEIYLEIVNMDNDQKIEKRLNRDKAKQSANSVSDWFADQAEKGVSNIIVTYRTKTASGWNHPHGPWTYKIGSQNIQGAQGGNAENSPANTAPAPAIPNYNIGLASPGGQSQGLSFADAARLTGESMMLQEKREEIRELKNKLERLEKENDELKDVDRAHAHKAKTAESQASMVSAFAPILSGLSEAFMKGKPEGLAAPGANLSQTKQAVCNLLADPNVNDGMAEYAYHLISLALGGKQKFIDQYVQLVQEYANTPKN